MTFLLAKPSSHYRSLRLVSEHGRWEAGLSRYPDGTRVRMGLAGRPPGVIDICAGTDPVLAMRAIAAVTDRLLVLPEDVEARDIDAIFPWASRRPDRAKDLPVLLHGTTPDDATTTRAAQKPPDDRMQRPA